jgi:hypothetical protein
MTGTEGGNKRLFLFNDNIYANLIAIYSNISKMIKFVKPLRKEAFDYNFPCGSFLI